MSNEADLIAEANTALGIAGYTERLSANPTMPEVRGLQRLVLSVPDDEWKDADSMALTPLSLLWATRFGGAEIKGDSEPSLPPPPPPKPPTS